jgi:hypothetical protein
LFYFLIFFTIFLRVLPEEMGDPFPYGKLGYWDLEDFMIDITEVVSWEARDGIVFVQTLPLQ